jgi:hypothetical protein
VAIGADIFAGAGGAGRRLIAGIHLHGEQIELLSVAGLTEPYAS